MMDIKKYLNGYSYPDAAARDIVQVKSQYRGLSCRSGPFVFNDGTSAELAHLEGTIPVSFKGVYYNIPVSIWLLPTHPMNPPVCYVKPTPDMQIKVSQYVDYSGKIYLPYLHDWSHARSSDLMGLIQVMIITFGEHPPVYSKPKTTTETVPSTPYPQQSYMPMPGIGGAYPPYPTSTAAPYPAATRGPAPYPTPYPTSQQMPFPPTYHPPTVQPSPATHESNNSAGNSNNSGTITDEHIKISLLSAIEHKVKRRLEEQTAQQKAEIEILQQTANELNQGKTKISSIIDKLNKEKSELDRNILVLKEKDAELEKAINELTEQQDIDVDEAVTTTAPLYKQILTAYAEEAATEDAIYYMGEALRRGVIDLDVFLKQVRSLSRKQFKLRALMQKCRQKAGLAG